MYGIDYVKLIGIGVVSVFLFLAGWNVNGWRWSNKYDSLVIQHKEMQIKAEQEARTTELALQSAIDKERKTKDEQIRIINAKLTTTLNELRQRPLRPTNPSDTRDIKGTTGSELYREDAEFLIREAARADEVRAGLQACYASYDAVRTTNKIK